MRDRNGRRAPGHLDRKQKDFEHYDPQQQRDTGGELLLRRRREVVNVPEQRQHE